MFINKIYTFEDDNVNRDIFVNVGCISMNEKE